MPLTRTCIPRCRGPSAGAEQHCLPVIVVLASSVDAEQHCTPVMDALAWCLQ